MGTEATTFPFSKSETTMTLSQTLNRRLCLRSMARPLGPSPGAIDQRLRTSSALASKATTSLLSSLLTKIVPLPSVTANSGLPPRSIVPATLSVAASMAVALAVRPLKVKTRPEKASYMMASGFWPETGTSSMTLWVLRSKTVTELPRPLEM